MSSKNSGGIRETIKTVSWAVVIAVVVRTVAFEPFNIPSGSMIPTLLIGDYLFVSKYSYGYSRHSLPLSSYLPRVPGRILMSVPERGDIAVFKLPKDNSTDYIKRIIGLPGDKIQVRLGRLWINGKKIKRERVENFVATSVSINPRPIAQFTETLPNGSHHRILEMSDSGQLDNTQIYTVPKGQFFAMGDNRDNSLDSRVLNGVGFIPAENLVGRAEFLFFSHNGSASWWEIWRWAGAIRFHRLFKALE